MSEDMPERIADEMPDRIECPKIIPEFGIPKDLPDRMPEHLPERMSKHTPERLPGNMLEILPEQKPTSPRRYTRENVRPVSMPEHARKNVRIYARENVRTYFQNVCQNICQKRMSEQRRE